MNILLNILGGTSIVLLLCDLICGLWIRKHPQSDMNFHVRLGVASVIVSLVTIVLFMVS